MDRKIKSLDLFSQRGRPSILIRPTNVNIVEGQSHIITCSISSISGITDTCITWIKTTAVDYEIVDVVGVNGKFSGGTLSDPSLKINNIIKSDEGTYVCIATNCFGTTSSKYSVLTFKDEAVSLSKEVVSLSKEVVSLSKEVNNFFRLFYLCQKIGTQAVRFFFDSKVPGHTLESFLNQHKSVLASKKNVHRCTKDQKPKLFPGGHVVVVSADFDFTLLYKLIRTLFTTIPAPTIPVPTIPAPTIPAPTIPPPTIPAPTRGWAEQPLSEDLNEGDDIERIRCLRNFLAHNTKLEICDADFSTHWTDLSQAIDRLSKGRLSTDVESMRTKSFHNGMEEDIRKEQKQMRKDFAEIQKQVDANTQNIADNTKDIDDIKRNITDKKPSNADNKQEINNSNSRHTQNEVDEPSVTDPLLPTTPVDSNPRQSSGKLPDKVLSYVASKLGSDWTEVVLVLDITHSEIEQIQLDYPNHTTRQTTKALIKWRDRQHNGPQQDTIKQLIRALEFTGRRDIIDDLKEDYGIY